MINHSPPAHNSISTRFNAGAAVPCSFARLCRLPRVRKANGLDFCGVGRPEARPGLPAPEGSSPSSAPFILVAQGRNEYAQGCATAQPDRLRPVVPAGIRGFSLSGVARRNQRRAFLVFSFFWHLGNADDCHFRRRLKAALWAVCRIFWRG
jgi:hypothetical protein